MATWYCRPDATADTNAGNGPGVSAAVQKLGTALGKAAAGDVVYAAPGVYREALAPSVAGASGNLINVIGDVAGDAFGVTPGRVRVSNYLVNDVTLSTGSILISLTSSVGYLAFTGLDFNCYCSSYILDMNNNPHDVTFTDCSFTAYGGGNIMRIISPGTTGAPLNLTFDRCRFLITSVAGAGNNFNVQITLQRSTGGADYNANVLFRNCFLLALQGGTVLYVTSSGSGANYGGGVVVQNSTILCAASFFTTQTTTQSTSIPCKAYNNLILAQNQPFNASAAGQIVEDYNLLYCGGAQPNVTAGTHSKSNGAYAMLLEVGQALVVGQPGMPFLTPTVDSPALNFGNDVVNVGAVSVDLSNRQRPAGGAANAVGALERHDTGVQNATTVPSGASNSIQHATPADNELTLPVTTASTTVSIQVYRDGNYGAGTKPTLELLAAPEIGVSTQSVADAGAASTWNAITLAPFTPTAKGVVRLRLHSYAASTGNAYWGALGVA